MGIISAYEIDEVTAKDEVSSLQSQSSKDKEAMKEEYQKAMEVIFAYGYMCCVFKHNFCGDRLEVLKGMPDSADPLPLEFFVNPRWPPYPSGYRGHCDRSSFERGGKELVKITAIEDHGRL